MSRKKGSVWPSVPPEPIDMDQEQQFLAAFDEHADALFRHCFFRVSDRERALELVQDTYMRAWEYIARGERVKRFRPFLYRVLNNLIVDEYRKKKETSLDALLEADGVTEGQFEELREGSFDAVAEAVDANGLLEKLEELPERYREAVTLRFVDGLSPKEIAGLLEETENAVSVRVHRGLRMLRDAFEREA